MLVSRAKVHPKSVTAKTLVLKKQKRELFAPFLICKTQNTILQMLLDRLVRKLTV